MPPLGPQDKFGPYVLKQPIGQGGMGKVWAAHEHELDRDVALKLIAKDKVDEQSRRRFLNEARAMARLNHPNIVVVYRTGEENGEPYVASELVDGVALDKLERPVEQGQLRRIALGLARGLAEAHAQGILHRDVKPSNAILRRRDGEVKLLDFGLAKFFKQPPGTLTTGVLRVLTAPGTVMGTPQYLAPEIELGGEATEQSDLYSLGALLHDLSTAGAPSRQRTARELRQRDPALAGIVERCLREAPEERYSSARQVVQALERLGAGISLEVNPYQGLRAFAEEQSAFFAGREREVADVVHRIQKQRFVVVAGDSGVGKSSLCSAGVLPRVRRDAFDWGGLVHVLTLMPGRRPLRALAEALVSARAQAGNAEALVAWLQAEPNALESALLTIPQGTRFLLFIDQLEELLTVAAQEEVLPFCAALAALYDSKTAAHLLCTVRGDFFTRLTALPRLGDLMLDSLFILRPMQQTALRKAIEEPAKKADVHFESTETVDVLVAQAASAAVGLPVLQFTLSELWECRDAERRLIPAQALERIGGVSGALTRHADDVLARLRPLEQPAARRVLMQLVSAEGTRARRPEEEVTRGRSEDAAALEALVQGRLVGKHKTDRGYDCELVHEALIQEWKTLRGWLDALGDRRQIQDRIAKAAEEWDASHRSVGALWDAARLLDAARIDRAELTAPQLEFLDRSSRHARFRKRTRRVLYAAGPLVMLAVVAGVRWRAQAQLNTAAAERLGSGQQVVGEAHRLDGLARQAREMALALFPKIRTQNEWDAAHDAWGGVLARRAEADARYELSELAFESALAIDPRNPQARKAITDALFRRANLARLFGEQEVFAGLARRWALHAADGQSSSFFPPAHLGIDVKPHGTRIWMARYEVRDGKAVLLPREELGVSPLSIDALRPGSYLLGFVETDGRETRLPLLAEPRPEQPVAEGSQIRVAFDLPRTVPDGFVFVPPGNFISGVGSVDEIRDSLGATPAHVESSGGYFIGRHEVTFAEYVEFLETLPSREQALRRPLVQGNLSSLSLVRMRGGWELWFQPTELRLHARWGESIRYPSRSRHAVHDWRKFPVSGISLRDANAYAGWLSKHVPGAHVCDDLEWERAGRGADGRQYTTGDKLDVSEVNIDATYGRDPRSFGPDEVGSHPESASAFGVEGLVGNASELVVPVGAPAPAHVRGGNWHVDAWSARLPGRFAFDETTRKAWVGFRVCAPAGAK